MLYLSFVLPFKRKKDRNHEARKDGFPVGGKNRVREKRKHGVRN